MRNGEGLWDEWDERSAEDAAKARVDVGPSRGYNRKGEAQGKICRGLRSLRRGFLVGVTVYMPL